MIKKIRSRSKKIYSRILAKIFPRHLRGRQIKKASLRSQAFILFQEGLRPAQVSKMIRMPMRTALRYYESYKQMRHLISYGTIRRWLRKNPDITERVISMLADKLGMSREEVTIRMMEPWGLLRVLKGQWPDRKLEKQRGEMEDRLQAALEVVLFAEKFGGKDPKEVIAILTKLMIDKEQPKQSSPRW